MNEKINLRQLAQRLPADVFGKDGDNRSMLVSELFGLVAEMLINGEKRVALSGFGSFILSDDASNPVLFIPDKAFADIVNAPFASFTPVTVASELTDDMLDSVVELEPESEPEVSVSDETVSVDDSLQPDKFKLQDTMADNMYQSVDKNEIEEKGEGNTEDSDPNVGVEAKAFKTECESSDDASEEEMIEASPLPSTQVEMQSQDVEHVAEDNEAKEVKDAFDSAKENRGSEEAQDEEKETEIVEDYSEPSSSRFGVGFFWGMLAGLLVGAIAFLVYVILTSNITQVGSEYGVDDIDDDTAALISD